MEIRKSKLDELYKEWSEEHHISNINKEVNDSAECCDFVEYCLRRLLSSGEIFLKQNTKLDAVSENSDKNKIYKASPVVSHRYSDLIWRKRNECISANLREPDNVMMHPRNKRTLYEEIQHSSAITIHEGVIRVFGMLVVWTPDVGFDDIVCTYNKM